MISTQDTIEGLRERTE